MADNRSTPDDPQRNGDLQWGTGTPSPLRGISRIDDIPRGRFTDYIDDSLANESFSEELLKDDKVQDTSLTRVLINNGKLSSFAAAEIARLEVDFDDLEKGRAKITQAQDLFKKTTKVKDDDTNRVFELHSMEVNLDILRAMLETSYWKDDRTKAHEN
jgi:hypothetical protein